MKGRTSAVFLLLLALGAAPPWSTGPVDGTVEGRIAPPEGFRRVPARPGGFGAFLRTLPVRPGRSEVRLHDGRLKGNQSAHHAVLAVDVGPRDLQQCADAVMRLWAEHRWAAGRADEVCFRFTSGDAAPWQRWRKGSRPRVKGRDVAWVGGAAPDASYRSFRRYLDVVFTYAGTASLERELLAVADPTRPEPGDVLIQGGHPGHAVLVLDVAEGPGGERVMLLAQSFMPAQEIHVLRGPKGPWFPAPSTGPVVTPEWTFRPTDLRRFPPRPCPPRR